MWVWVCVCVWVCMGVVWVCVCVCGVTLHVTLFLAFRKWPCTKPRPLQIIYTPFYIALHWQVWCNFLEKISSTCICICRHISPKAEPILTSLYLYKILFLQPTPPLFLAVHSWGAQDEDVGSASLQRSGRGGPDCVAR